MFVVVSFNEAFVCPGLQFLLINHFKTCHGGDEGAKGAHASKISVFPDISEKCKQCTVVSHE